MRRVALTRDSEVLLTNREDAARHAPHPRTPLDSYIHIPLTNVPILPDTFVEHPISLGVAVPYPSILRFFPAYCDGPYSQRLADVRLRYSRALEAEALCMMTVALATDLYWTGQSVLWRTL